jgi:hypothetical protein
VAGRASILWAGARSRDGSLNAYGPFRNPQSVDPRERELLTGMGNCYAACGADFDGTVGMVADSRHRTPDDVKQTLAEMSRRYSGDPEYQKLRGRLPPSFPF